MLRAAAEPVKAFALCVVQRPYRYRCAALAVV